MIELIRIPICNKTINDIVYHNRIKEIIVGSSDGKIRIYCDKNKCIRSI